MTRSLRHVPGGMVFHVLNRGVGRRSLFDTQSFPIETDEYFYQVVRYVERNPLRADLVSQAEHWPWSSATLPQFQRSSRDMVYPWPLPRPTDWLDWVNRPETEAFFGSSPP